MLRLRLRISIARQPVRQWSLPASSGAIGKILIFAYHGLGNFILFLPALHALRALFPDARIELQFGPETGFESLARESEIFNSIVALRRDAPWREWRERSGAVRTAKYDLLIGEFHGDFPRLAYLIARSGVRHRLGHVSSPGWSNVWSFLYNIPVVMEETQHEVDRYFELLKPLGGVSGAVDMTPRIQPSTADTQRANELLPGLGVPGNTKLIGFQVGTSPTMRWKQWPLEKYADVLQQLAREYPHHQFVFLGSAGEREMIEQVVRRAPGRAINLAGLTGIGEAAAILRRCELLICNDSGLMHLAAAVGTRVVAIYGPTDLARTRPVGDGHQIVRTGIECSPCFKLEGTAILDACAHKNCLAQLDTEMVHSAVIHAIHAIEAIKQQTSLKPTP